MRNSDLWVKGEVERGGRGTASVHAVMRLGGTASGALRREGTDIFEAQREEQEGSIRPIILPVTRAVISQAVGMRGTMLVCAALAHASFAPNRVSLQFYGEAL